ncbi:Na+/H+ antiporter NhaC family protein [Pelistega europaea]|nr:Na+/H+ antiporter NhaC family protein [Pelistega europaea]
MFSTYKEDRFFLSKVLPALIVMAAIYGGLVALSVPINAVVLCILLMVAFCLLRIPVAVAIVLAALLGGLHAGMDFSAVLAALNDNLLSGAQVGVTYVMVGAFAVALARSGLLEWWSQKIAQRLNLKGLQVQKQMKWTLFIIFIVASLLSQNLVPVHIAFIPVLIPPLLGVMNKLNIDRRAVVCILACCMSASYLLLPFGFGAIYLNDILLSNFNSIGAGLGLNGTADMAPKAMFWPVMGIIAGMLFGVFVSYRKPRVYKIVETSETSLNEVVKIKWQQLLFTLLAIVATVLCQVFFDSLFIGALIGFVILGFSGIYRWQEQDDVFTQGVRLMAEIAIIITIASGFAGVLNATGDIEPLVKSATAMFGDSKVLGVFTMLVVGLFITIGFGDSFASVPILAPIYIPLSVALGLSPLATMSMLGAAAALGDAGSPASTITLGATAGLNADGQHNHVKDSVIPAFLHANVGMLLFAFVAILYM